MQKTKDCTAYGVLFLLLLYLGILLKLTVFRASGAVIQSVNLVPFYTIAEYTQSVFFGVRVVGVINLLGNVCMFIPLGYLSALLTPAMRRAARAAGLSLALSVGIELLQYALARGAADVDDVILNTLGGVLGYGLFLLTAKFRGRERVGPLVGALMLAAIGVALFGYHGSQISASPPPQMEPGAVAPAAWYLILVNRWNPIPDGYEVELTRLPNGQRVDSRIAPALQELLDAAQADGVYAVVTSGYRTAQRQQELMDEKIAAYRAEGCTEAAAIASAEAWVAPVGTSEHQLGIAVDLNADGLRSAHAEVYAWLAENSHRYGFTCRYPADKTEQTGVINEPWHYRYVGVDAATEMHERGLCLEEYLEALSAEVCLLDGVVLEQRLGVVGDDDAPGF